MDWRWLIQLSFIIVGFIVVENLLRAISWRLYTIQTILEETRDGMKEITMDVDTIRNIVKDIPYNVDTIRTDVGDIMHIRTDVEAIMHTVDTIRTDVQR